MKYFLFLPFLLLSACAFTDIKVDPAGKHESLHLSGGDNREIVLVIPLADERVIQNRCGMKKNGYNMDTASVMCSTPPVSRLVELVAEELKSAGFNVRTQGDTNKTSGVKIQGTLLKFFVEPVIGFAMGSIETDINIHLVATSKNGLNAERSFFVKGTESAMAGTESNFQSSVDDATAQIVKQMVTAIITLMNRYPDLGQIIPIDLQYYAYN
jgi:uncharacterized lipoprotein YajG